jgi:hypothetical protein
MSVANDSTLRGKDTLRSLSRFIDYLSGLCYNSIMNDFNAKQHVPLAGRSLTGNRVQTIKEIREFTLARFGYTVSLYASKTLADELCAMEEDDLRKKREYQDRLAVVTNMSLDDLDAALLSRGLTVCYIKK